MLGVDQHVAGPRDSLRFASQPENGGNQMKTAWSEFQRAVRTGQARMKMEVKIVNIKVKIGPMEANQENAGSTPNPREHEVKLTI